MPASNWNNFPVLISLSRPKALGRFTQGYSLPELLIVLAIVAILMVIGLPSYTNIISANNVTSEINGLLGDLQFARSEAVKRGQCVRVCAADTSAGGSSFTCNNAVAANWYHGWFAFVDTSASPTSACNAPCSAPTGAQTAIRVQSPLKSSDTAASASTTPLCSVAFNYFGFSTTQGSITFTPAHGNSSAKTLCVSGLGSLQTVTGGNSVCPP